MTGKQKKAFTPQEPEYIVTEQQYTIRDLVELSKGSTDYLTELDNYPDDTERARKFALWVIQRCNAISLELAHRLEEERF